MKKVKIVFSILLGLAMAFSMFACGTDSSTTGPSAGTSASTAETPTSAAPEGSASTSSDDGITVRIGVTGYLGRFLAGIAPSECHSACDAVFDTIFKTDAITRETKSDVLQDWYWESDNVFIMEMYDNIYFSNGDKATADDLLFSYVSHKERGSNYLNNMFIDWDKTAVRDDLTVAFYVTQKNHSMDIMSIYLIDKSWSEQVGWDSEEWYYPVSSGPYMCVDYAYDDHITLQLRENYWARDISDYYVKEYDIKYYADVSTMYMDLELGNIDFCEVGSADYSRFLKSGDEEEGFNVILKSNGVVQYFNLAYLDNPIWENENLRMAVAYGINWPELGQLMNGDMYSPANSVTPSSSSVYVDVGTREYDPDKAIEYLRKAGYAEGQLTLKAFLMDTPIYKAFGQGVTYYLDKIGINTSVDYGDVSTAIANWIVPGNNDFGLLYSIGGSSTVAVQDSIQQAGEKTGVSWTYVDDDQFQKYYGVFLYQWEDKDLVKQTAKDIQQYIYDNALILPIAESVSTIGYRTDLMTEDQINTYLFTIGQYQLSTLGLNDAWGK